MDPVVPSERKWDWGIIYYNLEAINCTFSDSVWIHRVVIKYKPSSFLH